MINEFIIPLETESYDEYINRIRSFGRYIKEEDFYKTEVHHIIPKTKGGSNDENNLIRLYIAEHFYAHKLLYLENKEDRGLRWAYIAMSHLNRKHITPYELQIAREDYYQYLKTIERTKIICIETGKEYLTIASAARDLNVMPQNVSKVIHGLRATAGGYHFLAVDDEIKKICAENRQKMRKCKQYVPVYCPELDKIYESVHEAARETGVDYRNISAIIHGKRYKANGYHFQIVENNVI